MNRSTSPSGYNPNKLFDALIMRMNLHNDASLARVLEVTPVTLSKIREHRIPVGASLLLRMREASGLSMRELRDLMEDQRARYLPVVTTSGAGVRPSPINLNQPRM